VILKFPFREELDWRELEKGAPEIARLWKLAGDIETAAFGESKPFASADRDEELQEAGALMVPEMESGSYDKGFRTSSLQTMLKDYRGPLRSPDHTPRLVNAGAFYFSRYVAPKYPGLARNRDIEGTVEVKLKVNPNTGQVRNAQAVSGPDMFKNDVIAAASQWLFVPGSTSSHSPNAVIDFSLRCPNEH
jgi:TonB family protein